MEAIRAAAVDGVCSFAGGGVEVGGVLFGSVEEGAVHIRAARPVECSHTQGPSFTLENAGEAAFREAMAAGEGVVVGWYHSHTRSGLALSEQDAELHGRFFPEEWKVALLIRPEPFGTAEAAFFTKGPDGSLGQSPAGIFKLHPPSGHLRRIRNGDTAATASRKSEAALAALWPPSGRQRTSWKWIAVAGAIVLIAAAALAFAIVWRAQEARPLGLELSDESGQLYIRWNSAATPVRRARGGTLEIDDGGKRLSVLLTTERLRSGSVTYARRTDDIEVRMKVQGLVPAQESVRVVGLSPPTVEFSAEQPRTFAQPGLRGTAAREGRPERPLRAEGLRRQTAGITAAPVGATHSPDRGPLRPAQRRAAASRPSVRKRPASATVRPLRRFAGVPRRQAPSAALPQPPQVAARTITPRQAPAAPVEPAQPPSGEIVKEQPARDPQPQRSGPTSGRLIWVGHLERGERLSITGARASAGFLNGELPGIPIRISAHTAKLAGGRLKIFASSPEGARAPRESASARNGWNETSYAWDSRRLDSVIVTDVPSPSNGWKGITLRGNRDRVSVVVIEWRAM